MDPSLYTHRRAQTDFERLVRPHLEYLYRVAYRFTGARDRAEDLLQDLLERLYAKRAELAHIEQLRPWLVRVLYRLFIDQKRHDDRAPYICVAEAGLPSADSGDPYGDLADGGPGPEAALELNLECTQVLRAWERLSDDHKALLTLFEIEGYTLNELETMLDVTRGTLKSRLHRARARLAQLLAKEPFPHAVRVRDTGAMR